MTLLRGLVRFGFIAFVLLLTAASALAVELRPEIQEVEQQIETKIQQKLRVLYGEDLKLAVNVHVIPFAKKGPDADADVGYAPFAEDFNLDGSAAGGANLPLDGSVLSFESVEVDLQVPEEMDDKVLASVKGVIENSLKGLTPKVSVSKLPIPRKPGISMDDSGWKANWKFIITMLCALLVTLVLTGGIGFSFKTAAEALAQGMKGAASGGAGPVENKTSLTLNGMPGGGNEKSRDSDRPLVMPLSPEKEYDRNLQLVRQTLQENPLLLVQTLRDSEAEWQGLRSLLPSLTEEERGVLKKCLGARVSRLASDDVAGEGKAVDSARWLRDYVERLMLRKVAGGSDIEKVLGPDLAILFGLAHQKSLLEAARAVDNRAGWRILTEYYPKQAMGNLYKEVNDSQWWTILSAAEVSPEEIQASAIRMAEMIQQSPFEGTNDERLRFYRSHLLVPAVNFVKSARPGRDDAALDDMSRASPDLARLVNEKVWTPKQLNRVPNEALARALRDSTYETKAALLAFLPKEHAARVENLLPPGNIRSIAGDQAKRLQRLQENAPEVATSLELVRNFLETLRVQAADGKFVLEETTDGAVNRNVREAA